MWQTTFVTAAAGKLKCPIYVLNLADPYLSDLALLKLVTDAQPRSILLAEDVDAAFHVVLGSPGSSSGVAPSAIEHIWGSSRLAGV